MIKKMIAVLMLSIVAFSCRSSDSVTEIMKPEKNIQADKELYFVRFRNIPVCKYKTSQETLKRQVKASELKEYGRKLEDERKQFRNDYTYLIKSKDIIIRRDFRYITNTIVIETTYDITRTLKKASYIEAIEKVNKIVEQDDGPGIVNAPAVWQMKDAGGLGVTGKGTVVAVLDSAFNMTHPAFSSNTGSKIIGNWDFENNAPLVSTSLQDHGTSVSGIVLQVAPDAKLLMYQVGDEADIITALEKILDPDNDSSTSFLGADVLNISLMLSYGDSGNMLATAFDDASTAGLVCVAAAGNEGAYGNFTIGNPAAASSVIAVGNTMHFNTPPVDYIYESSSRGPVQGNFLIKPDLCAPGYMIYAPRGSDSYMSCIGTSFSAPIVAGAAALLVQLHPDWTPAQIKAALAESSVCLDSTNIILHGPESVFAQGAGMLDIKKAAEIKSLIQPCSISFGACDPDQAQSTKTASLEITNVSNDTVSYTFEYQSVNLVDGIDIDIQPSNVTLAPEQSASVTCWLTINSKDVPKLQQEPFAFEGWILAVSEEETLRVPFAVIYADILNLSFDPIPDSVIIHNSGNFKKQFGDINGFPFLTGSLGIPLTAGTYDIMTAFNIGFDYVVKEDVLFSNTQSITITMDQADNEIKVVMRDRDNKKVTKEGCHMILLRHKATGTYFYQANDYVNYFNTHTINTSTISSDYSLEWAAGYIGPDKSMYFFNDSISGITDNITSENSPADFKHFKQTFNINPDIDEILVADIITDGNPVGTQCSNCNTFGIAKGFTPEMLLPFILTPPFTRDVYMVPAAPDSLVFKYFYSDVYSTTTPKALSNNLASIGENRICKTPLFSATSSSVLDIDLPPTKNKQWKEDFSSTTSDTYQNLSAPYFFSGMFTTFVKNGYQIRLLNSLGAGIWNVFPSISGDFRYYQDSVFEVFMDNIKIGDLQTNEFESIGIKSIDAYNMGWVPMAIYKLTEAGTYTVRGKTDYQFNNKPGTCSFAATFNMSAADKTPPYVRSLQLLCDGKSGSTFIKGMDNKIVIEAYDYGNEYLSVNGIIHDDPTAKNWELGAYNKVNIISLEFTIGEGEWVPLALTSAGNTYTGQFSWPVTGTFFNLRIKLADAAGNTMEQYIKPAFRYIDPIIYPEITGSNISCGNANISPAANIRLVFNKPMNTSSVEAAFSITPPVNGTMNWYENDTIMMFIHDNFQKSAPYTFTVSKAALDTKGIGLQADYICSFSTYPEDITPPVILSTNLPKPPDTISTAANIVINFSAPMNTVKTEKAFSISPYASGTFTWKNGNRQMRFDPDNNLKSKTKYTVKINTDAVCTTGEYIEMLYTIIFQTD